MTFRPSPSTNCAIVDEAHRERHKVASHASALNGVHNSVEAGVDTIEHGHYISDADLKTMVAKGTYYVPTLFVGEYVAEGRAAAGATVWVDMIKIHDETFRRAMKAGVKIAFGTDAGGFDWKINPAKEFPIMVKYGMTPAQALHSAKMTAAELLGMQDKIGSLEAGQVGRHRRGAGRSAGRHPAAGERGLRDEGRRGVREAVKPRLLAFGWKRWPLGRRTTEAHRGGFYLGQGQNPFPYSGTFPPASIITRWGMWGAALRGISPVTRGSSEISMARL